MGIDRAIFYTASARVFQGIGGVVSVLLVASFLTGVEQGFYYTFASILAIQIFFELGLGGIITQFVAHEKAHLNQEEYALTGEEKYRSRLAYLLKFCLKWYSILAIVLVVVLDVVGYLFFTHFYKSDVAVQWEIPWILLVAGTSLNFILSPISAYLEGLGKVKEIAYIRLWQQVFSQVLVWSGLILGAKLYVVFFAPFLMFVIFVVYCWRKFGKLLLHIYNTKISERVSYRHEIFPYQWKIGLSWISGYFIFQLFNPVLFATEGAVVAGQMGMTLAILNSISAFALSWITTKVPKMSECIARKDYLNLDILFNRAIKQQIGIAFMMLVIFVGAVFILRHFSLSFFGIDLADRLLPYFPLILMSITIIANQYIHSIATYLRCHKQEPFLVISIVSGILCVLSTLIFGNYFGVIGITIGYCVITVGMMPWGRHIFITNKRAWHDE